MSQEPEQLNFRVTGMMMTFVALVSGALVNLGITGLLSAFGT